MASRGSRCIFMFLLSPLFCSSCNCISAEKLGANELGVEFQSSRRELSDHFNYKTTQHDLINPPVTTYPTTPVYNPVTTPSSATNPVTTPGTVPPDNSGPAVVTVPATNPVGVTPNPVPTPTTIPPNTPIPVPNTNPVNPAAPVTNPVTTPATNPVTTAPGAAVPVTVPVTNPTPVPVTNAPSIPGQSWCVARSGMQDSALQSAIDYACGFGGADCSTIQQGGTCYIPNTLQNHASVAFNSYYKKNPSQTSCDFGGTAMITNVNPSAGSCAFVTLSSSAAPGTAAPSTASTAGANPISSGAPPTVINAGNPALGSSTTGFGDGPPSPTTSSTSTSNHFRPTNGCITLLITTISTWITVF